VYILCWAHPLHASSRPTQEIFMGRIRFPLAALVLIVLAACQSTAPTAPSDAQGSDAVYNTPADSDTTSRGGTLIGTGT
jgi:hypothetical protein